MTRALYAIAAKEPVLLGKAVMATVTLGVLSTGVSELVKGAIITAALAWVGWGERLLSTPNVKARRSAQRGYDKAVSDIGRLASPPPPPVR